ncbi:hypothetical protein IVA80_23555 [Bradyrhizobium sp. 139]|uniref:S1/P1 nuclease n=1 Tax=Bradyrhizobium sp. 139 TaxID=2782616 RepID=UPI001FFB30B4|nr:S1/P1 nuclease [Bradyrhizobium sp. 139]MCK1743743.1 hypothetical protein [Bradyrhizobium sp. 139]
MSEQELLGALHQSPGNIVTPLRLILPIYTATFVASTSSALAWGQLGHSVIAELAQRRLSPAARAKLKDLIGDASLAAISSWADDYKFTLDGKNTHRWHFVDIEPCINNDQGGNKLHVVLHAKRSDGTAYTRASTLHSMWNDSLVDLQAYSWGSYADAFDTNPLPAVEAPPFDEARIAAWANETHTLGINAYQLLPPGTPDHNDAGHPVDLNNDYAGAIKADLDAELAKGAARLKAILDDARSEGRRRIIWHLAHFLRLRLYERRCWIAGKRQGHLARNSQPTPI